MLKTFRTVWITCDATLQSSRGKVRTVKTRSHDTKKLQKIKESRFKASKLPPCLYVAHFLSFD